MASIEKRRVQRTGSSSYIITLPKEWVEAVKLKSGDYVIVEKHGDKLILIPPTLEPSQLKITIRVYPGVDAMQVFRVILAAYINGYNTISLVFDKAIPELPKFINDVKSLVRMKLPGIEVVEEQYGALTFKVLLSVQEMPLISAIRRLHVIVNSMIQDTITLLSTGDLSVAQGIIQRDDEADRFHHMINRELATALIDVKMQHDLGISNITEALSYRIIARNLERIADHATSIAKRVLAARGLKRGSQFLTSYLQKDLELLNRAMNALYTLSRKEAEEVIGEVRVVINELENAVYNKILAADMEVQEKVVSMLILDSVKRIARYCNGIAESIINLKVAKSADIDIK
jgi:AbrB family looped-hinge helix DNA binding protein